MIKQIIIAAKAAEKFRVGLDTTRVNRSLAGSVDPSLMTEAFRNLQK